MEMNELFYQDAYLKEFDAKVISCTACKNGFDVVLEDTAFYPESFWRTYYFGIDS